MPWTGHRGARRQPPLGDHVGWPWARAGRVQRRTVTADEHWTSHLSDTANHVVEAIRLLLAFGVVFRPFDNWVFRPVVLERESNPQQTRYERVALPLSYPVVAIRESNSAPCGATIDGRHQLIPAARHVRHPRTNRDAAHRRGKPCLKHRSEPLPVSVRLPQQILERPCISTGTTPRQPCGQPLVHVRADVPAFEQKVLEALGTYGKYTNGMRASSGVRSALPPLHNCRR